MAAARAWVAVVMGLAAGAKAAAAAAKVVAAVVMA